jgi:hypothetical protein
MAYRFLTVIFPSISLSKKQTRYLFQGVDRFLDAIKKDFKNRSVKGFASRSDNANASPDSLNAVWLRAPLQPIRNDVSSARPGMLSDKMQMIFMGDSIVSWGGGGGTFLDRCFFFFFFGCCGNGFPI